MDGQRELHDMRYIETDIAPHLTITEWRTRRLPAQRSRLRRLRRRWLTRRDRP
jgi:hypothetical protein